MSLRNLLFAKKSQIPKPDYYINLIMNSAPFFKTIGYKQGVGILSVDQFYTTASAAISGYHPGTSRLYTFSGSFVNNGVDVWDTSNYPFEKVTNFKYPGSSTSAVASYTSRGISFSQDSSYIAVPTRAGLAGLFYKSGDTYTPNQLVQATGIGVNADLDSTGQYLLVTNSSGTGVGVVKRTGTGGTATWASLTTLGATNNTAVARWAPNQPYCAYTGSTILNLAGSSRSGDTFTASTFDTANNNGQLRDVVYTPDSSKLILLGNGNALNMWTRSGNAYTKVTTGIDNLPASNYASLRLSPDGSKLFALTSNALAVFDLIGNTIVFKESYAVDTNGAQSFDVIPVSA